MTKVLGGCLGAVFGLIVGVVLSAGLLWVLAQVTDLHGAPLELVALVFFLCLIGGIVLGVVLRPEE